MNFSKKYMPFENSCFFNEKFKALGIRKYQKNMKDIFDILMEKGNPRLAIRYAKRIIKDGQGKTLTLTMYKPPPPRIFCNNKICGEIFLKDYIEERAVEVANYIIENGATVRQTARQFCISKSTVHIAVTKQNG